MKTQRFIAEIYGKKFTIKTAGILFLAVTAAVLQFLSAFYLGRVTDSVSYGRERVVEIAIKIAIVVALHFMVCFWLDYVLRKMSNRLSDVLRRRIVEKICKAEYKRLTERKDGDLFTIATTDIEGITEWFLFLTALGQAPVKILIVFLANIRIHWLLFVLSLVLYPLVLLPSLLLSKKMYAYHLKEKEALSENMNFMKATLSFMVVLKSFCLERIYIQMNHRHLGVLEEARRKKEKRDRLIQSFARCAGSFVNPFLFTVAAYFILKGEMTIGQVISMIFYIDIAGESINQLSGLGRQYQTVKVCVKRISSLLEIPDEQIDEKVVQPKEDAPVFDVREVSFAYSQKNILQGISFQIHKGDKVAVMGKSGSGKSTIFKLLNGLYAPDKGTIAFKGQNISEWSIDELRKRIAVVPQESFVFSDTVYHNISIARPEASAEEVKNACRLAKLHDFIETLADGYDTVLNDVLVSLSNGQMQRINLARAFLRDTEVYLFDEPTSALDARNRDAIMEYITTGMKEKTVLCIIHEPELIPWFNVCITVEDGKVSQIERRKKEGSCR